jgi:fructose-1,6-bisphosphatase/sedoheptulose 1,7-bisphosphatase-like protein/fructose/tagatose bisphosphate aldolase
MIFVFNTAAMAGDVTCSQLRAPVGNGLNKGQEIQTSLQEKKVTINLQNDDGAKDGQIVMLARQPGLMELLARDHRRVIREATNNGTEHGAKIDAQGNRLAKRPNLIASRNITDLTSLYGVPLVFHGLTDTDPNEFNLFRAAGMEAGHIATHKQDVFWRVLLAHQDIPYVREVVNKMIDYTIARFGSDKKYNVPARSEEAKKTPYDPKADKNLNKLLDKELKNALGPLEDELNALPKSILDEITVTTKDDTLFEIRNMNNVGTGPMVSAYLKSWKNSLVTESNEFAIGSMPLYSIPDNLAVETSARTAAVLTLEKFRGGVIDGNITGSDKIQAFKDKSDGRAKQIYQEIADNKNVIMIVRCCEGFGRDAVDESFKASEIVIPGSLKSEASLITQAVNNNKNTYVSKEGKEYTIVDADMDVIEGTNMFVTNVGNKPFAAINRSESGAMSIIVTGVGLRAMGNSPDYYTDGIFTRVKKDRRVEFVLDPLDPEMTAAYPSKTGEMLGRIAVANDITIGDMEVVIMDRPREAERLKALQDLQKEFPGMAITTIKDGTVAHAVDAMLGRATGGKFKVVMTVGGSPEFDICRAIAGLFKEEGAICSGKRYSLEVQFDEKGEKAKNLKRRYAWKDAEKDDMKKTGMQDYDDIIAGKKLLTQEDVQGEIEGSFSLITHNGVFGKEGVKVISDKAAEVNVLRFNKVNGLANAWWEKKIVDVDKGIKTVDAKPEFVFQAADNASLPGYGVTMAYRDERKDPQVIERSIGCYNIRTLLSAEGVIMAAKEADAVVFLQLAMSEFERMKGGYSADNVRRWAQAIKDMCKKHNYTTYALKGDHITVKVNDDFLKDTKAQDVIAEAFTRILAEKNADKRVEMVNALMADKEFMNNPNVANGMKKIKQAMDHVRLLVSLDFTVFALDASFMPMRLDILISAFLAGFIPPTSGIEAEVGEIGGKENSTSAEGLELLTGNKYLEKTYYDKDGNKYSKLVRQGAALNVTAKLDLLNSAMPEEFVKKVSESKTVFPLVMDIKEGLRNVDGLAFLQNVLTQLKGKNIVPILYLDKDVTSEELKTMVMEIAQKLNKISGNCFGFTTDSFQVMTGSPEQVAAKVKEKFNTDIYRVIGSAKFVEGFKGIKAVTLQPAGEGQVTLMSSALREALESILVEGAGNISVAPVAIDKTIRDEMARFEKMSESEIRI